MADILLHVSEKGTECFEKKLNTSVVNWRDGVNSAIYIYSNVHHVPWAGKVSNVEKWFQYRK